MNIPKQVAKLIVMDGTLHIEYGVVSKRMYETSTYDVPNYFTVSYTVDYGEVSQKFYDELQKELTNSGWIVIKEIL